MSGSVTVDDGSPEAGQSNLAGQSDESQSGAAQADAGQSETVEYGGLRANLNREGWSLMGLGRIMAVVMASIPLISIQYIMVRASKRHWWHFAGLWHRTMARILGMDVRVAGVARNKGATLFAANHISWVDILVLGGHIPNASFIAKSEVAGWGLLGSLCTLHKTEFVNRSRRTDSARQRDALAERVKEGHSLILFPEGTNTSGVRLAPFKSALFSVAEQAAAHREEPLYIQPITLAYTEVNGMPLVRSQKPWVAWLGDVELFSHLRQLLTRAKIVVTVEYHQPVTLQDAGCRKNVARYCEEQIASGLERAHRAEMRLGPARSTADAGVSQHA